MGMTRIGYWVEKTPDGEYVKRPVTFYFDDAGNLVGMRDPNGNTRGFVTQYSVSGNSVSYTANACDYFIATVPAQDWVWFTPNAVGFKDANGQLHMLYHSVDDIFKKRADVTDYLKTYHPTCFQYYAQKSALKPSCQTSNCPASQATALKEVSQLPKPSQEYIPTGVAPQPLATTSATAGKLAQTGNCLLDKFAQAMLAAAPPGFREVYNLMVQEGARQELILAQKLPPERYQYYQELKKKAIVYTNQFPGRYGDELFKQLNRAIYLKMLQEAGLTEQDMLKSSPYIPQLTQTLGSINPSIGQLAQYAWYEKPQQEEKRKVLIQAVVQKIQQLPPEKKAQLRAVLASALAKRGT